MLNFRFITLHFHQINNFIVNICQSWITSANLIPLFLIIYLKFFVKIYILYWKFWGFDFEKNTKTCSLFIIEFLEITLHYLFLWFIKSCQGRLSSSQVQGQNLEINLLCPRFVQWKILSKYNTFICNCLPLNGKLFTVDSSIQPVFKFKLVSQLLNIKDITLSFG